MTKSNPRASKRRKSSKSRAKKQQPASSKSSKTYPYKGIGGGLALKPGVPLTLIDKDGKMLKGKPVCVVDSGCDFTTLPKDWMGPLGIDEGECLEAKGSTAGGQSNQWVYPDGIKAGILGRTLPLAAIFSEGCPLILLGREDFFRFFKVTFNQAAQSFSLEVVDDWDGATAAATESIKRFVELVREALRLQQQATPIV